MPLSLLLQETVYTFRWGATHLEPWVQLVRIEETLIDRARGAFLTHWFGPGLPLDGSFVRIAIANLAELRGRYFQVVASLMPDVEGPSLVEPLAGLIGQGLGIVLSPTGALLIIAVSVRRLRYWMSLIVGVLDLLLGAPLGLGLGGAGLPLAVLGAIILAVKNPPAVSGISAVVISVTKLLMAATDFVKLLLGPRDKIANPLLRDILVVFDRLAGLAPFVLEFVAFIVTHIGPLIRPLVDQIAPFRALIDEVVDTVVFLFKDIGQTVKRYLPRITDQVDFVLEQLAMVVPVFGIVFTELLTNLTEALLNLAGKARGSVLGWYEKTRGQLVDLVLDQPISKVVKSAMITVPIAARNLSSGKSSSSSSGVSLPTPKLTSPADMLRSMGGPPPGGLGAIDILAKIDIKHDGALFEDYLPFSREARKGFAAAVRPTNVFGVEHVELARQYGGKTTKEALAPIREKQLELRDLLSAVVGRVLPSALRVQMGNLLDVFRALDQHLYQVKVEKQDYPIRDLPDNGQLRPIVHRLVVRGIDLQRADAETFQKRLQEAISAERYPAEKPGQGFALSRG